MNVNEFKAELIDGGARPNLYKVTLPFPTVAFGGNATRRLSFMCKAAQIPSQTVGVIPAPFLGRVIPIPGDRTFEDWTITVLNDGEFQVRDAFERWHNAISFHSENIGVPISEIYSDGVVEQLNRQGEVIKSYTIKGAFPSNVAAIELGFDSNDAIEEFAVTFSFLYWESTTTA